MSLEHLNAVQRQGLAALRSSFLKSNFVGAFQPGALFLSEFDFILSPSLCLSISLI